MTLLVNNLASSQIFAVQLFFLLETDPKEEEISMDQASFKQPISYQN